MYNIPQNYPVELIKLIHEYKVPIEVVANIIVDWQTVASYRNEQEQIDIHSESSVKSAIAFKVAEKVDVLQNQCNKQGREYFASMFAMKQSDLLELLYLAYREGFSRARDTMRLSTTFEGKNG